MSCEANYSCQTFPRCENAGIIYLYIALLHYAKNKMRICRGVVLKHVVYLAGFANVNDFNLYSHLCYNNIFLQSGSTSRHGPNYDWLPKWQGTSSQAACLEFGSVPGHHSFKQKSLRHFIPRSCD